MDFNTVVTFLACIIILFILGKIFVWPFKSILKLIFNSILGGILIYIINVIGMNFNFHIGLNILTSVLVGLLGVPGAVLLIILKIILRIRKRGQTPISHFWEIGVCPPFFTLRLQILQGFLAYQHLIL